MWYISQGFCLLGNLRAYLKRQHLGFPDEPQLTPQVPGKYYWFVFILSCFKSHLLHCFIFMHWCRYKNNLSSYSLLMPYQKYFIVALLLIACQKCYVYHGKTEWYHVQNISSRRPLIMSFWRRSYRGYLNTYLRQTGYFSKNDCSLQQYSNAHCRISYVPIFSRHRVYHFQSTGTERYCRITFRPLIWGHKF